jgi:hypothetical protein
VSVCITYDPSAQRYLGDVASRIVHDLSRESGKCLVDTSIWRGTARRYGSDCLSVALRLGYRPCRHCLTD